MPDYLFVYGTLMRGAGTAQAKALARSAELIGPAVLQGKLFLVDWYPALIPSDNPGDQVHGELYRLPEADILGALDRYEECGSKFPEPREFRRARLCVHCLSGDAREAWVYIYNRRTEGLKVLKNGRFLSSDAHQDVTQE